MVVVDTNVLLAALITSKGWSFRLLEKMLNHDIEYLVSLKLISEYWSVVTRHENMKKIPLSLNEIEALLAIIAQNGIYQDVYYRWRPNLSDESDNFILELAIAGQADSIVTFNRKDFEIAELKFDLSILSPRDFLQKRSLQ
ncbi:MAG: putative toxin-antitoxin system toxin component, PIN family [Deltaproteobacteria bacterium]|nr:MAG: putative toxin-antitoxin system toxin component, PIN family [Deltaproteobacteria bacterium]